MDKLERILQNSARRATEALPVDAMWESLQKAARIKRQKRKRFLRQASMAAMLIVGLGIGAALGRSSMFWTPYVVVDPPKTDVTPAPNESVPDSTVVDPPGDTIPDNIVVDPPKTDPGTPDVAFVDMREFKHIPETDSIRDLLPGWLPDVLQDQRFTQDIPQNYWAAEASNGGHRFAVSEPDWSYIQELFRERAEGLPEGINAETLPVGTGVLLLFTEDRNGVSRQAWYLRTGDYSY
ncbi:MAG TPA: hypothetical protein VN366_12385, partial [Feifaniaceae bacterium]|nr:hypothetical protein [Feifaniaceae bacterium]